MTSETDRFINVLLLGETGVGKSTFVNSLANYLAYQDFKNAEKAEQITLIPMKFNVKDKHSKYHEISVVADDQSEYIDTGMLCTGGVSSFVLPIGRGPLKLRLVDTPGIGLVGDIEQDNANCENIFKFIGRRRLLHGICVLLHPSKSKTVFIKYCMAQILSRLETSAVRKIIFIFTNTRGSGYGAGNALPRLRKCIEDIKVELPHVNIRLDENVFCVDNEAFQFLAAAKKCVKFNHCANQKSRESWRRSVKQCDNLIRYMVDRPLRPHVVQKTKAVNQARRFLVGFQLSLSKVTQLIKDNIVALLKHEEYLGLDNQALDLTELRQKLYMPVITKLTEPVTVCVSKKCSKDEGDNSKWLYRQICHAPCHLRNVPKETVGSPGLLECAAFNPSSGKCKTCRCDYSKHKHVDYLSKKFNGIMNGKNGVEDNLLENARKLRAAMAVKRVELQGEYNTIVNTCIKFVVFLQRNAVRMLGTPYREYIEYQIEREQSLALPDTAVVGRLQKLLQDHQATEKFFKRMLSLHKETEEVVTSESDTFMMVEESIQGLFKLKHTGNRIKELYEYQDESLAKVCIYTG